MEMKSLLVILAAFAILIVPSAVAQPTQSLNSGGQTITAGQTISSDFALTFSTTYGAIKGVISGSSDVLDSDGLTVIWTELASTDGEIWATEYCDSSGICPPDFASYSTITSDFATLIDVCGLGSNHITEHGVMDYTAGPGYPANVYKTTLEAGESCNYALIVDSISRNYGSPVGI